MPRAVPCGMTMEGQVDADHGDGGDEALPFGIRGDMGERRDWVRGGGVTKVLWKDGRGGG